MSIKPTVVVSIVVLVVLLISACDPQPTFVLPTLASTVDLPAVAVPTSWAAVPPTATHPPTPTVTPSPTSLPTATPRPTVTPSPTATHTPSPSPTSIAMERPVLIGVTPRLSDTTPVPTAVPPMEVPEGAINILVLGSDQRPDWDEWHTDVVQVVSIQPDLPAVTILSVPRDLYVYIPGYWMSRINFADMYGELYGYEGGGPALLQQTFLYNLGIPIDHYVRTNFDGFIGIVDTLGGIDIPVHCHLEDHWPYPDENGEYPVKVMVPGVHHMDGETALWYARSRMTTSVFAREARQQQVLKAIWRRARSQNLLTRVPELWSQYRQNVVTDLELGDAVALAQIAFRVDEKNVRMRNIGAREITPWVTPKGGYVFLPNWEEIEPVVSEALGPVPEGRQWRTLQTVEVWNGTGNPDWEDLAADRLARQGFGVVIGEPDRRDYAETQLVDFTTTAKGSARVYLQNVFNVWGENVILAPDAEAPVPYRLILGRDYQACRFP